LLAFFASFVLETEVVAQIMRWDMAVLRESPWYQEILQQGLQQGESALILRQLTHSFGELPESLRFRIEQLPTEQLERLGEALLGFQRLEDLQVWLDSLG
jgi:predicted transposase YdaD